MRRVTPVTAALLSNLEPILNPVWVFLFVGEKPGPLTVIGAVVGWIVTFTGYTLGRAFIYSTPAYAIAKLPFQILQTAVGSAIALFLCWGAPHLVRLFQKEFGKA